MSEKSESNASELKVKIDVDCSEALTGLKAVTRASKNATAALKELEEQRIKMGESFVIPLNVDGKQFAKVMEVHMDQLRRRGASI